MIRATGRWRDAPRHVAIPATRDPFINTPLIRVRRDAEGWEWFWISTYNGVSGCLGVLVSEGGDYHVYRFDAFDGPYIKYPCFYSAAVEDEDTLWLCPGFNRLVRFTLSTGACTDYSTGMPWSLVFHGMVFDRSTGKLFLTTHLGGVVKALSFDTRAGVTARVFDEVDVPSCYMRASFPNGDGTHSILLTSPANSLLRWDPRDDSLSIWPAPVEEYQYIRHAAWGVYFPGHGWHNPLRQCLPNDGPRPETEMSWFDSHDTCAYGVEQGQVSGGRIFRWEYATGTVTRLCDIPDSHVYGMRATESGKIVAVNYYGIFSRHDAKTGVLEMSRCLPADAVGQVDRICRIDDERLLGASYITQRFWEVNLRTGAACDCGRAAPGEGEIRCIWRLGGKVYMAAYNGGELVEYDPAVHPHFPENPRVVADPPGGMRPVAQVTDGRHLYYSCSMRYGHVGSVLTKYDTETGLATYAEHPLPGLQITSLQYQAAGRLLICGASSQADCNSAPPVTDRGGLAGINADTLQVCWAVPAPPGKVQVSVLGVLADGRWLCRCDDEARWFALDVDDPGISDIADWRSLPEGCGTVVFAGKPGHFLLRIGRKIERWDMDACRCVACLVSDFTGHAFCVQDGTLYLMGNSAIDILEHACDE